MAIAFRTENIFVLALPKVFTPCLESAKMLTIHALKLFKRCFAPKTNYLNCPLYQKWILSMVLVPWTHRMFECVHGLLYVIL